VGDSPAILNALLDALLRDRASGRVRSVAEYQALFPGHDDLIRAEIERLTSGEPTIDDDGRLDRPGARIGRYVLESEIGRGGQGSVWVARDERLDRRVAIKLLLARSGDIRSVRERFRREALVASRLDHSGICAVHEAGEVDGIPFVAMALIEGETLSRHIASLAAGGVGAAPDRDEVDRRVRLIEQAARALHAAHEAGVVHRDVKPGNLMVARGDRIVVLDFGLARDLESEGPTLTQSGDVFGTPSYMSPEQLASKRIVIDRRTDVWSLGITLHELLAGGRPFDAPTREGLFRAILEQTPPPLRTLVPAAPGDLEIVLSTALQKDRDHRYLTAQAFADDLAAAIESRPIAARKPSSWVRLARYVVREPLNAALRATLLLAMLGVAGLGGYLAATSKEIEQGRLELRRQEVDQVMLDVFGGYQRPVSAKALVAQLAADPTLDRIRFAVVYAYLERRELETALSHCEGAREPDAAAALDRLRVAALRELGRNDEAAAIEQALGEPKGSLEHFAIGLLSTSAFNEDQDAPGKLVRHFTLAALLAPRPDQLLHTRRTLALLNSGDHDGARDGARMLQHLWPDSALVWLTVGTIHGTLRDAKEARVAFERATELEPTLGQAWLSLAISDLIAGENEKADRAFARAMDTDLAGRVAGSFGSIWGRSLIMAGRVEASVEPLRGAIAENPNLTLERATLVNALLQLDRGAEAIEPLRAILERDPKDTEASRNLIHVLRAAGETEEAIAECERRLAIAPDDADAAQALAELKAGGSDDR
jgi:tetratricopeptide (TPR) repeat protein